MPEESVAATSVPPKRRRLVPGPVFWLFIAAVTGVNIWTHLPDFFDHAVANIIFMASAFVSCMVFLLWLAFMSAYKPAIRRTPLIVVVVLGIAWIATHRIYHVSGEMQLAWIPRWAKPPDELLPAVRITGPSSVPLSQTTEQDFPQFLGPTRSAGIDRISLARDWTKQPPQSALEAANPGIRPFRLRRGQRFCRDDGAARRSGIGQLLRRIDQGVAKMVVRRDGPA